MKEQLPDFMKSMLCLTVYEAKGLEFDDVILFNFFAMGEIRAQQWKFLQNVSESASHRQILPDWVLDIDEDERSVFIEDAIEKALAERRAARKAEAVDAEGEDVEDELKEEQAEERLKEHVRVTKSGEYRQSKVE